MVKLDFIYLPSGKPRNDLVGYAGSATYLRNKSCDTRGECNMMMKRERTWNTPIAATARGTDAKNGSSDCCYFYGSRGFRARSHTLTSPQRREFRLDQGRKSIAHCIM